MDSIFLYFVKLPDGIDEVVMPCLDGYTVYIDENLSEQRQLKAYAHAVHHIRNNDFERSDVQEIESKNHIRAKYFESFQ